MNLHPRKMIRPNIPLIIMKIFYLMTRSRKNYLVSKNSLGVEIEKYVANVQTFFSSRGK